MIYLRMIPFFIGIGDGLQTAHWRPFTSVSATCYVLLRREKRNQLRPFSTAKASKQRTSADPRGTTLGKKINGRKRHLLVDVMGLVLVVWITAASVQDRDGAVAVFLEAHREYPTLKKVWVDGVYKGKVIDDVESETGIDIEMVKRTDDMKGFVVLP